jgi:hypothetical protein
MPKRLSEEFEEWARTAVRRRPTTPEQLTNSIRYIMLKKERLIKERILYPLGPREWKLELKKIPKV